MKTMFNFLLAALALVAGPALAGTVGLAISQAEAFQYTHHNCGGINVYETATGFDAAGQPTAEVLVSTRCNNGGRGAPQSTYSAWLAVTWDVTGNVVVSIQQIAGPDPSLDINAAFDNGDEVEYTQTGTFWVAGQRYVRQAVELSTP